MPRPSASIHELTWAGLAPTAPAAWKTITAELANPTSTVTKPAATADTDRSRARDTRPLYSTGHARRRARAGATLLALVCGCQTAEEKKDKKFATLRLHVEVTHEAMDFSTTVPIFREKPVSVTINKDPFITEADVSEARIIDDTGVWAIQIQLTRRGSWLLEQQTTSNPGAHIAIFSEWGSTKPKQARWLAAPALRRRISDGRLTFTPDATHEEAEEIVLGLSNLAKVVEKKSKW
jgi:PII-like signaling protein